MTVYNISTSIETKNNHEDIIYEMELYKKDDKGNKIYALKSTGKQPLQANNKTLIHQSLDISDPENTSYILELNLYHKHKLVKEDYTVLEEPMTAIIPLKGFIILDKKWGLSREFKYNETVKETQSGTSSIFQVTITSKPRVFEVKEHPVGDPLDPFTKAKIERALQLRLAKYDFPYQGDASLCGPAAFFYCLLMDRPDLYKQIVKELWESGKTKIGTLKIKPGYDCRHPTNFFTNDSRGYIPKVSCIDWITLASLRDSENSVFDYDSPDDQFSGITTAGDLKTWFEKSGAKILYSINTSLIKQISGPHLTLQDLCRLNSYISPETHVVVLITAKMITNQGILTTKNHWIVWTDKLKLHNGLEITEQTVITEKVQLELFSWGKVKKWWTSKTLGEIMEHSFAAMVVSKIP
jgi:hypothetical protein